MFYDFKDGDIETLLFRRTCESKCCWENIHSNNAFILKYSMGDWFYYCYGDECGNGRLFKIGDSNELMDLSVDQLIENLDNSVNFHYNLLRDFQYCIVPSIPQFIERLKKYCRSIFTFI